MEPSPPVPDLDRQDRYILQTHSHHRKNSTAILGFGFECCFTVAVSQGWCPVDREAGTSLLGLFYYINKVVENVQYATTIKETTKSARTF